MNATVFCAEKCNDAIVIEILCTIEIYVCFLYISARKLKGCQNLIIVTNQ